MPDGNENEVTENLNEANEETTASTELPTGEPQTAADFRFDESAGDLLAGRTAAEAVDIVSTLATYARQANAQLQAQQHTHQEQPQESTSMYDDDLWVTQPAQAEAKLEQRILQNVQTQAAPILRNQAQTARALVSMNEEYKEDFKRWGPEIDAYVNRLRPELQTAEAFMKAASLVRADHVDELVDEKVKQRMTRLPQRDTVRSNGHGEYYEDTTTDDVWDTMRKSEIGRSMLEKHGKSAIIRAAEAQGRSVKEYAELVAGSRAKSDPSTPGVWRNTEMTRG